jgi:dTDP-glucose 4,6-dehydratase
MFKCLLVTGGLGFIGSHFINYMLTTYPDLQIINVDRKDYCSREDNVLDEFRVNPTRYRLYIVDLVNTSDILGIIKSHQVDGVVHFAAQSHVDNSFGNSMQFTRDNVLGTHSLMEACREYIASHDTTSPTLKRIVHISTDEVYGEVDTNHPGCTEKSLLNPTNPYAASKAGAEFIVKSYFYSFRLPIIITRGNNVFGPNQYPEKIIPRFALQLLQQQKMTIHGAGTSQRNFIYADDVATAVDTILQKGEINHTYNIGGHDEFTVLEIAEKLRGILAPHKTLDECVDFVPDRLFNDMRYCVINDELLKLGWTPKWSFEDGLRVTIEAVRKRYV